MVSRRKCVGVNQIKVSLLQNKCWQSIGCGPNPAHCLILCGLQPKNGCYLFKQLDKDQKKDFHDTWKVYEIQKFQGPQNKLYWNISVLSMATFALSGEVE